MDQHHIKKVEEFEKTVEPFFGLWKSLVIRLGWTTSHGIDMVVYLNATFETEEPERIVPPLYSPAVEGFHATWIVKRADEIPEFIRDIKAGIVQAEGKKLKLGLFQNREWRDSSFSWSTLAQKDQNSYLPSKSPAAYLQEFGSRLEDDTYGALTFTGLKSAWRVLPHPYMSSGEVFEEYFKLKSIQAEGTLVFVHALFPITFVNSDGPASGGIFFRLQAPKTVDLKRLTVGQIISFADGTTERGASIGDQLDWRSAGNHIVATIRPTFNEARIKRAHAIIRYGKLVLDESNLINVSRNYGGGAVSAEGVTPNADAAILSPDKPLADPKNDRFGYAPFAKHLAECILKMSPQDGIVMAVYGPWGSGKSTLMNFLTHYLKQVPESEQPIIIQFNPWLFSGHEDLAQLFFAQLLGILKKWTVLTGKLQTSLSAFAERISKMPLPGGHWWEAVAKIFHRDERSILEIKGEVEDALRSQPKRFLVVIDDIDRLVAEEIRQVFRLVKAVANFPNVTYLLSFDKEVAIKAIGELQHTPGEEYLEKIVQVPFELPQPEKSALRRLLFEKLDLILGGTPSGLFDSTHWGNIYYEGIDPFIATPRDVMRLTNTLRVTYASVLGEVNAADFIAIESIRVFCPTVYGIIRANMEEFAGSRESGDAAALKVFHDGWLNQVDGESRADIKKLALRLFPKLEGVWGNTNYGDSWLKSWRKALRICSPEVFPVYFRMAVPEGSIASEEMRLLLALIGDKEAFASKLLSLSSQTNPDGTTRLRAFLERLIDHIDDMPIEDIQNAIKSLYACADRLIAVPEPPRGMFDFGTDIRIGRIMFRMLKRLPAADRVGLLKSAIAEGDSPIFSVHEVCVLGQQHGKYGSSERDPEGDQIVSEVDQKALESVALEKIRETIGGGKFVWSNGLVGALQRWADWGSLDEVKKWMDGVISDDKSLAELLKTLLQKTFSQTVTDVVSKSRLRLNPKWLERFSDLALLAERVKTLEKNDAIDEEARRSAAQFLVEYKMILAGKDPDAPFAWRD